MNDGMSVIVRAVDTRMHTNNFARGGIYCPFHHITIKSNDHQLLWLQVGDMTCCSQQHAISFRQSHTHVAVSAVRHDARLIEEVGSLYKLFSQLTIAQIRHDFLAISTLQVVFVLALLYTTYTEEC